jgi:hypothetical protein
MKHTKGCDHLQLSTMSAVVENTSSNSLQELAFWISMSVPLTKVYLPEI